MDKSSDEIDKRIRVSLPPKKNLLKHKSLNDLISGI